MQQLARPARRALLVVHVTASVGWLGLTLGLLTLGITGAVTASPDTAAACYRAMKVFGDWLIIPISLLSLVSGVVLALGTPWGLARHRWVYLKFWLTPGATAASAFALRSSLDDAVAAVSAGREVGAVADSLLAAPSVSLSLYVFMTAISVLKPWGLTRRGRRLRAAGPARRASDRRAAADRSASDRGVSDREISARRLSVRGRGSRAGAGTGA
ncbi:membrane protein [Streptomyces albireticuli]|uniref:Membrane protein n=1 Tax=Streptomyces albireticuli TaxID=1940 RepID=A0A1Z2L491_9ACTN|nr:DUF2269 domain-containing protein [Streptomyces albireticuli]ARZ69031.1 membrane protein [Streptomyces albireticuli]